MSIDLRHIAIPLDIVGDVHGCLSELYELLTKMGYEHEGTSWRHSDRRLLVFLGDLGDRGPHSAMVFSLAMDLVKAGQALYTPGNHCNKLLRFLQGRRVTVSQGLAETIADFQGADLADPTFSGRVSEFIETAPPYLWLDSGKLVVAHAGIKDYMIGKESDSVRRMCIYGDITGDFNPDGTPVRLDWAEHYTGSTAVAYGHTPAPGPVWKNNTINLDQGCVFGGWLSAMRWPEREVVQVRAHKAYSTERTPAFLGTL